MERVAVFIDDAAHAKRLLAPMLAQGAPPAHWLIVACPPQLTHRIGKWVAHTQREQWRATWLAKQRSRLQPLLAALPEGSQVDWLLAKGLLTDLSRRLRERHGVAVRILDARRPKLGQPFEALQDADHVEQVSPFAAPLAAASGLSVVLALAD